MGEDVKEFTFTAKVDAMSLEPEQAKKRRSTKQIESEIKALRQEQESNAMHEQNLDTAKKIYDLYESYLEVGFDEEQAWELIITMVQTLKN